MILCRQINMFNVRKILTVGGFLQYFPKLMGIIILIITNRLDLIYEKKIFNRDAYRCDRSDWYRCCNGR